MLFYHSNLSLATPWSRPNWLKSWALARPRCALLWRNWSERDSSLASFSRYLRNRGNRQRPGGDIPVAGRAGRVGCPPRYSPLLSARIDQIAENLTAAESALAKGDLTLCSELGKGLHDAIIDKADRQRLTLIIRNLDDHFQRFRTISDQISGRLNKSVKEHRRVLDALRKQDADAAERAMHDHLHSVLQDISLPEDPSTSDLS